MAKLNFNIFSLHALTLLLVSACGGSNDEYLGDKCYPNEPPYGQVKLNITINPENRAVPVEFYLGNYDENRTPIIYDTLTNTHDFFTIPNGRVGVAVTYMHEGKTVIAIDDVIMDSDDELGDETTVLCGDCCFYVGFRTMNLRLNTPD